LTEFAPQPVGVPPKRSNTGKIIGFVIGGVVLLLVIGCIAVAAIGLRMLGQRVENASIGDCMPAAVLDSAAEDQDLEKVDCGSAEAAYRVVGMVKDVTSEQFDSSEDPCSSFATARAALWVGAEGRDGKVLCLEPVTL
jgi:hypothetical protein